MQFVGPPFTFSIRQVGSNCGCIGQHATVYADGKVFWMGAGGGFLYLMVLLNYFHHLLKTLYSRLPDQM